MTDVLDAFKKCDQHSFGFPLPVRRCQFVIVYFLIGFALLGSFEAGASKKSSKTTKKAIDAREIKDSQVGDFENPEKPDGKPKDVATLMKDLTATIKKRKYEWDMSIFKAEGWQTKDFKSVNGYPLIYYTCGKPDAKNSSLILSSVHGDEVTPIFFGFRLVEWLKAHQHLCENSFIVVAPMVNPDGFMRYSKGTRTNWNKIDVNRNFDTPDFDSQAMHLWKTKFKSRRYYPGEKAATEPEVLFQKWLIDEFSPSKILSIHAPLNFLDYDGPQDSEGVDFTKSYVEACEEMKGAVKKAADSLEFYAYGVFPGSLGNYAGKQKGIPTFTVELPTTKWEYAAKYFGDLEMPTELFIKYELKEHQSRRMTKK